jgi:SAM-dependent methyltransferase
MPIGSHSIISHVARALEDVRPRRVLDLGIGFGFYGAVVRQWLDLGVRPWKTYLAGVEAWGGYSNPLWDVYDLVTVKSIQDYLQSCHEEFDFVIMNDVLEHLVPEEGRQILGQIDSVLSPGGRLIVGTPARFFEQGAVNGNEFERHRSFWTAEQLRPLDFEILLDGSESQLGFPMVLGIRSRKNCPG